MPPAKHNTCGIVVTYHPDSAFPERLARFAFQVALVIIVDNGSRPECVEMLRNLAVNPAVRLIWNASNLGIAKALNQGIYEATRLQFEWAVTLDQDTIVYPEMMGTLFGVYNGCAFGPALVGGNYWNAHLQRHFHTCSRQIKDSYIERRTLITSGTLMRLDAVGKIGGFREDYFIDFVDHELCLRARAHGYRLIMSCKPVMSHTIGHPAPNRKLFKSLVVPEHSPIRKYYLTRNLLVTVRNFYTREPAYCLRQVYHLAAQFASIFLFQNDKRKRLAAFGKGVWHAFTGKMGPIETI